MTAVLRDFDPSRDRKACYRIWEEVGWFEPGREALADLWFDASRGHVAELEGPPPAPFGTSRRTCRSPPSPA